MGKKIFVSYKYSDDDVKNLETGKNSIARDYVNKFEEVIKDSGDDIYKGEEDDEDLSNLEDDTIWEKLKTRIYDSSITVIFISPDMKESGKKDRDQWIPWEISYSLKEESRQNKNGDSVTSHSNAMLGLVLPDNDNSYSYFLERKSCCGNQCILYHSNKLFSIHAQNTFTTKKEIQRFAIRVIRFGMGNQVIFQR